MRSQGITAVKLFTILTVLTGLVYPLAVTLIAQAVFPEQSSGSRIHIQERLVGSSLIAQKFESDRYFHPRPSATDFNPLGAGGSNLGPTSLKLKELFEKRLSEDRVHSTDEMLFNSASGLDPHISPVAARLQMERVASARHFSEEQKGLLEKLIQSHVERRQFGFLGQPRINVLKLNVALDTM